ncbi:hypothetical protein SMI01S_11940 [Sphingobacterium mizutaii NBRC 14946 = DSM 11724]|uniref:PRTRC system protein C n=2 Tax=Sphingobacterium mizutaii TaxID=1010 RepID=A0AAJ5C0T8_9SPHI|nr:PRTRC system protein C [Sphingobacterium mizutaii]GEM67588.1 hypothetical protein SMI01S_11940 [Sphingobacterium mizutaii NBRC 14946 = DSM 11724]SDL14787.1 PRTRC system protein C [Sphingobacterium mizutaii]SNV52227.1 PRTRC system protein C [Sphingobacterium mizutaii]
MALQITGVKREFKLKRNGKDITIVDPNQNFSLEEVMSFLSNQYPELTTSTMIGPNLKDDGTAVYEFKTTIGTKG